jgi:hypothetical protein
MCDSPADANPHCPSGFQTCNSRQGVCKTNVNIDVHNCGKCNWKCPSPAHSNPTCRKGECGYTCEGAFRDCDSSSRNGCETCVENNPLHCGTCGKRCPVPDANSIATCSHGSCGIKCKPGFQLCNRACVDVENHVNNCGKCGVSCPAVANATATCSDGRCSFSCKNHFANCDGKSSNGCEVNTLTDAAHCGSCRASCPTVASAVSTCSNGQCSFTCKPGFANCDGKSSNGCEVVTSSNAAHCGSCGTSCPTVANAVSTCSASHCIFTCNTGFADCDGDPSNGCEVDTSLDAANCGHCGTSCPTVANAASICSASHCIFTCSPDFADCDGDPSNGCEVDTSSDAENCGHCGASCPTVANAVSTCSNGQCGFTCNTGFANCDGDPSNGCEVDTSSDTTNCGSCGASCPTAANAVSTCSSSECGFTCNTGFGNCDGNPSNGCEADTTSDTTNCGGCGALCSTVANAVSTCSRSQCSFTCNTGFANCDGNRSNGCEADTTSDAANCGSCGTSCPSIANAVSTCSGSKCSFTCNPGFADCDGDPSNGCEADLSLPAHCGSCFFICGVTANRHDFATCIDHQCGYACDIGFADCNGVGSDGCEVDLSTVLNCGHCGVVCPSGPNSTPSCSGGNCGLTCDSGFANCDGDPSNGCEVDLTSTLNCGSCGHVCPVANAHAHATCSAGNCGISCDGGFADCNGNPSDGCETNIASDNTNCGTCGCSCAVVVDSPGNPNIANTFCSGNQCHIQCSSAACTCDGNGCNCNNGLIIGCSSLPFFIGICNAPAGP